MLRPLSLLMLLCALAHAQTQNSTYPTPRLLSVFPCGGQIGSAVEVTVKGTDLDDVTALRFSDASITAEIVKPEAPKEKPKGGGNMTRTPTEVKFKVKLDAKTPRGMHEARVVGRWGISNPRAFVVDEKPEINETEPNSDVPVAQKVPDGTVVNGVIDSTTDVDYFRFEAKKGQRLLIHCAASSIDSRARPFLELYAGDGRTRLAINRNDSGNDALCDVVLPADGDYLLRVSEFAYTAGGSDFFYRLTFNAKTWIDAVYPPMIEAGKPANVTVIGRGTPGGTAINNSGKIAYENFPVTIGATAFKPGFEGLAFLPQGAGLADGFIMHPFHMNAKPVFFATAPVVIEADGENDSPEKAQSVTAPCEVAGRIDVKYDRDSYRFQAKKNEPLIIELSAERIGSNLDCFLTVRGPDGKEIAGEATLDDDQDSLHPTSFFTRTADPAAYRLIPNTDGDYTVTVNARDSNVKFGPRSIYRLRIAKPKPDFRAVVMARNRDLPSGVTVWPSGETAIDVFIHRLDGFSGSLKLEIKGLPAGVSAKPSIIGPGQKWGSIVLSGSEELKNAEAVALVSAAAVIDGKPVVREARSASITWGVPNSNNAPTIARLDRGLMIATRSGEKTPYRLKAQWEKAVIKSADGKERPAGKPLAVKPGEKIVLPVSVVWQGDGPRANTINVSTEPTFSTQGQSAVSANNGQPVAIAKDKSEATITLDVRATIPPGPYAVLLKGDTKAQMISDPNSKAKKEYTMLAFAEPFSVKVLPLNLGKLTATMSGPIKQGGEGTLTVKVERAFDYNGEFPLKVVFPAGSGLTAKDGAIPAGSNELRIPVTAVKDAKIGNVNNVIIESTAAFDGDEVNHKTQLNITIAK